MPETVYDLLRAYLLQNDLEEETEKYYYRIIGVLNTWRGRSVLHDEFTPDLVSEFLQDKQRAGCACHYRKSLRNGFRALLNFDGKTGPIRTVRLDPLNPESWTDVEADRLILAVDKAIMPGSKSPKAQDRRWYWKTLIQGAWYTGLGQSDLHRLDETHLAQSGLVVIHRSRTGKRAVVSIPSELATELLRRKPGPFWKSHTSKEYFRREFVKIVKAAGLKGTFKKLRKSSGTAVEILYPGRGHEHLANTRAVFEKHYLAVSAMPLKPLSPPRLTG